MICLWINSNLLYMHIKVHFTPLFIIGRQCEDINCNLYKRQDLHLVNNNFCNYFPALNIKKHPNNTIRE